MSRSPRGRLSVALALGVLMFACVLLAHDSGLTLGLAYLSPAVFVFALLCSGHYPGGRLLLARARLRRRFRHKALAAKLPRRALAQAPRGGELLASALAGRAPPLSRRSQSKLSTA
jgi:hypothetical protein